VVASIHWGDNWGYEIAHNLIDHAGVDIIHGHSSHHAKGIEVWHGKPVIYGCGDFINDYEGIGGNEKYRSDLSLMYFELGGGTLWYTYRGGRRRYSDSSLAIAAQRINVPAPLSIRFTHLHLATGADRTGTLPLHEGWYLANVHSHTSPRSAWATENDAVYFLSKSRA